MLLTDGAQQHASRRRKVAEGPQHALPGGMSTGLRTCATALRHVQDQQATRSRDAADLAGVRM
eukprot:2710154-Ditylum_brightwellii.AAC.1